MLGQNKTKIKELEWEVQRLQTRIKNLRQDHELELHTLRQQLAKIASGESISAEAILNGTLYNSISSEKLDAHIREHPDTKIIDVRTDSEWDLGHIPDAMHIELNTLPDRLGMIPDKNQDYVLLCARGGRSASACDILLKEGYTQLTNVEGGMNDYPGDITIPHIEPLDITGLDGDKELLKNVASFLDEQIRPNLKRDGGDLSFHGINEQGIAKVRMVGACGGCGSKSATVNEGIKNMLVEQFSDITGIQEI